MFDTENQLVETCLSMIEQYFTEWKLDSDAYIIREPKGLFGIPEVMIYNGKIISIEFKLKNWKKAMKQAYRYKNFSFESYVFLDEKYIESPLSCIKEFKQYNIGLCGVTKDKINIYYRPNEEKPYSDTMESRAIELFDSIKNSSVLAIE